MASENQGKSCRRFDSGPSHTSEICSVQRNLVSVGCGLRESFRIWLHCMVMNRGVAIVRPASLKSYVQVRENAVVS
jgi:hypothetical protein